MWRNKLFQDHSEVVSLCHYSAILEKNNPEMYPKLYLNQIAD